MARSGAGAVLWACLVLTGSVSAQGGLSAMDYIEIQQLVNRLNFALDYCGNGGADFADLFIDGGLFIIDEGDGTPVIFSTRQQLESLAGGPDCQSRLTPPGSNILHLAEGLVIDATVDGARGSSYAIYPARHGQYYSESVAGQYGIYHDEYVRTPDGWRFRSRRHQVNPGIGDFNR